MQQAAAVATDDACGAADAQAAAAAAAAAVAASLPVEGTPQNDCSGVSEKASSRIPTTRAERKADLEALTASNVRQWLDQFCSTAADVVYTLTPYQQQPQLLDSHLPQLVEVLIVPVRHHLPLLTSQIQREQQQQQSSSGSESGWAASTASCCLRVLLHLIYVFCKVRGVKAVRALLPQEPELLEQVYSALAALQQQEQQDREQLEQRDAHAYAQADDDAEAVSPPPADDDAEAVSPPQADDDAEAVSPPQDDDDAEAVSPPPADDDAEAVSPPPADDDAEAVSPPPADDDAEAVSPPQDDDDTQAVPQAAAAAVQSADEEALVVVSTVCASLPLWSSVYALFAWISLLALAPFNLHSLDSNDTSDRQAATGQAHKQQQEESEQQEEERQLEIAGSADAPLSLRLLQLAIVSLSRSSKAGDAAALLLQSLFVRPDIHDQQQLLLRTFLKYCEKTLLRTPQQQQDFKQEHSQQERETSLFGAEQTNEDVGGRLLSRLQRLVLQSDAAQQQLDASALYRKHQVSCASLLAVCCAVMAPFPQGTQPVPLYAASGSAVIADANELWVQMSVPERSKVDKVPCSKGSASSPLLTTSPSAANAAVSHPDPQIRKLAAAAVARIAPHAAPYAVTVLLPQQLQRLQKATAPLEELHGALLLLTSLVRSLRAADVDGGGEAKSAAMASAGEAASAVRQTADSAQAAAGIVDGALQTQVRNSIVTFEQQRPYRRRGGDLLREASCAFIASIAVSSSWGFRRATCSRYLDSCYESLKSFSPAVQLAAAEGIRALLRHRMQPEQAHQQVLPKLLQLLEEPQQHVAARSGCLLALAALPSERLHVLAACTGRAGTSSQPVSALGTFAWPASWIWHRVLYEVAYEMTALPSIEQLSALPPVGEQHVSKEAIPTFENHFERSFAEGGTAALHRTHKAAIALRLQVFCDARMQEQQPEEQRPQAFAVSQDDAETYAALIAAALRAAHQEVQDSMEEVQVQKIQREHRLHAGAEFAIGGHAEFQRKLREAAPTACSVLLQNSLLSIQDMPRLIPPLQRLVNVPRGRSGARGTRDFDLLRRTCILAVSLAACKPSSIGPPQDPDAAAAVKAQRIAACLAVYFLVHP
ncbi:beta-tubulin cofactor [Cyclospora cayetanensis]|uniref:Beta-tubulin cofactor n=1 Tax=Cyclospora cayetanensis TaxID=88456 RepID=A0A1D3CRL5_9EIME|nr:beta-tubulin cofactor [Cyclospora cayetanensis]